MLKLKIFPDCLKLKPGSCQSLIFPIFDHKLGGHNRQRERQGNEYDSREKGTAKQICPDLPTEIHDWCESFNRQVPMAYSI
jgi:hypothetical protein